MTVADFVILYELLVMLANENLVNGLFLIVLRLKLQASEEGPHFPQNPKIKSLNKSSTKTIRVGT